MSIDADDLQTVIWGPDRIQDLTVLWNTAAPDEPISAPELKAVCFEESADSTVVLATADGTGVVAAVVRGEVGACRGYVRLLAVHPAARRRGIGRALLCAAEEWLADHDARTVSLGGDAPYYLWPGIDSTNLAAQGLALKSGYRVGNAALNLALPTSFRADPPSDVQIRRLVSPGEIAATRELIDQNWAVWLPEFELGLTRGTAFAAVAIDTASSGTALSAADTTESVLGFCNHSNLRQGWIGPMGTRPTHRRRGIGAALLSAVCADLSERGVDTAQIAWAGPLFYFADLGASTERVFLRYTRDLA